MILAVAPAGDEHVAAVAPRVAALGEELVPLDLGAFPRAASLSISLAPGRPVAFEIREGARTIDPAACRTIWWRRIAPFGPDPALDDAGRRFALQESAAAFAGLWHALRPRWVNDPVRHDVASRKPFQLAVAAAAGLAVPRTLVTNDPGRGRAFLDACGRSGDGWNAIFKPLTAFPEDPRATRRVRAVERAALDAVRYAPVLFQEYVAGVDLRVVAVGDALFAMEVDARGTAYPEDCRVDWESARHAARPASLPDDVGRRLLAVMDRLGLVQAAIDLRRRDDGEHVFLEVNPSGLWLYVEELTGHPITDAVAHLLAGRRAKRYIGRPSTR